MELNINITSFDVEVRPVVRQDNIIAFVVWIFHTADFDIKITGCTLRRKTFSNNQTGHETTLISFEPPVIKGKFKSFKAFFIDNIFLYKQLCQYTMKKYCEMTGEPYEDYLKPEEEVNIDDIPF